MILIKLATSLKSFRTEIRSRMEIDARVIFALSLICVFVNSLSKLVF